VSDKKLIDDEPQCAAYEINGAELCRLDFAEEQHRKIKAAALLADAMQHSAGVMARRSRHAADDGDRSGATRAWCIAAREYDWASRLWDALGFRDRAEVCRALADSVRLGDDDGKESK
jgi:hypothetical protein